MEAHIHCVSFAYIQRLYDCLEEVVSLSSTSKESRGFKREMFEGYDILIRGRLPRRTLIKAGGKDSPAKWI